MHEAVRGELPVEERLCLGRRQLAVEQQVRGVVEVAALRQLLDVILRCRKSAGVCDMMSLTSQCMHCLTHGARLASGEARTPRYSRMPFQPSMYVILESQEPAHAKMSIFFAVGPKSLTPRTAAHQST